MDKQNTENDNKDQLQQDAGRGPGSVTNDDQASDASIGTGTADQGLEPGDEEEEDEFRKAMSGLTSASAVAEESDTDEEDKPDETPSKGLVEEGPGPDS